MYNSWSRTGDFVDTSVILTVATSDATAVGDPASPCENVPFVTDSAAAPLLAVVRGCGILAGSAVTTPFGCPSGTVAGDGGVLSATTALTASKTPVATDFACSTVLPGL
jgi:hypothetical protein